MKKKLTLSVDENLIKTAKVKAIQYDTDVSSLFEEYVRAIEKNKQVIDLIRNIKQIERHSSCKFIINIYNI